jgi:hypothetical protein
MNMRDEYLIHKTHRTFRAWLLPFALLADNLNAISCIYKLKMHTLNIILNIARFSAQNSGLK